jgi:hypothetical protein
MKTPDLYLKGLEILNHVFDFLNGVISDDGLYIFVGFVYLLIPFGVWALTGGLRRKLLAGKSISPVRPIIVIQLPVAPPRAPELFEPFPPFHEPPDCDHDDCCRD